MKPLPLLDHLRVWAALTGVLLAALYFVTLTLGLKPWWMLPPLITGIGGFELFLFAQDFWLKRRDRLGL